MARPLIRPNPENASVHDLKEAARVGSSESSLRCTTVQLLIVGVSREQVCQALTVTNRDLRKWANASNQSGIDGLIVNKRPGRAAILHGEQAEKLTQLIEKPEQVNVSFWAAKVFQGYICDNYKLECSYESVVRFFHR